MGPEEHWAPPESLDPTPVWKQYLLVGILMLGFLGVAVAWAVFAVAPDLARPPALVAGNRVVLAASDHPPGTVKRVELAGPERTFYLVRKGKESFAVRAIWMPEREGGERCDVRHVKEPISTRDGREVEVSIRDGEDIAFVETCRLSLFNSRGEIVRGEARRDLDRYLVSPKDDRFVVTLDRLIPGAYRR